MNSRPAILCPVDFSDASQGALRYARSLASHFGARLVILAVEDPLLTEAAALGAGTAGDALRTREELVRFVSKALNGSRRLGIDLEYAVRVGQPAEEILRLASASPVDLIVMSTHGLTGMRRVFFGSTTERVLRETTIPVLATPPADEGPQSLDDISRTVGRVLVPVDLTGASLRQLQVARAISEALSVPLVATHVVEPVHSPLAARLHLPSIDLERKTRAEDGLGELLATVPRQRQPEALVAYGDPAEEIARIAQDRRAGLVVIGLHGSALLGPRMGSVTYRVLCLAPVLVLALPPLPVARLASRASGTALLVSG